MKRLLCSLFGHPGWVSQTTGYNDIFIPEWSEPVCSRCRR